MSPSTEQLAEYPEPATLLAAAVEIARMAGGLVASRFHDVHQENHKGSAHNLVTEVDHASEALIVAELQRRFPDHAVVAEEAHALPGKGITWYVDPLDGTNNFAHGYPVFAVNLAAASDDGLLVGVTYDPTRDELFSAIRGQGAWLNGKPIRVSARDRLEEALVATGFPYDKATNPDNNLAEFVAIVPRVRGIRRGGSAALDLAYVACGRLDGYWERGMNPWDVAAGILLVSEAGGTVTDYDGRPASLTSGRHLATNGRLHAALMERLQWARLHPLC